MNQPDTPTRPDPQRPESKRPETQKRGPLHWVVLIILGLSVLLLFTNSWPDRKTISFSQFLEQLKQDNIATVEIQGRQRILGKLRTPLKPKKDLGSGNSDRDKDEKSQRRSAESPPPSRKPASGKQDQGLDFELLLNVLLFGKCHVVGNQSI